jgi:hypothetical protein
MRGPWCLRRSRRVTRPTTTRSPAPCARWGWRFGSSAFATTSDGSSQPRTSSFCHRGGRAVVLASVGDGAWTASGRVRGACECRGGRRLRDRHAVRRCRRLPPARSVDSCRTSRGGLGWAGRRASALRITFVSRTWFSGPETCTTRCSKGTVVDYDRATRGRAQRIRSNLLRYSQRATRRECRAARHA